MTDALTFGPGYRGTLCHPDGRKSCGACCGMYNVRAASKDDALALLHRRTLAFRDEADPRDTRSLDAFRTRWEPTAHQRIMPELPTCPFLGLLDVRRPEDAAHASRIGCLVHPLQNDGHDGRDCGVYDRETCETYLCASHQLLREREKWLVINAIDDSYLYGLVITDVRFVRELFVRSAALNLEEVPPSRLTRPEALRSALHYFDLKRDWRWRAPDDGIFGELEAGPGLDTPRRALPHQALGVERSRWDAILACLGTRVATEAELIDARTLVADRVRAFAASVR